MNASSVRDVKICDLCGMYDLFSAGIRPWHPHNPLVDNDEENEALILVPISDLTINFIKIFDGVLQCEFIQTNGGLQCEFIWTFLMIHECRNENKPTYLL